MRIEYGQLGLHGQSKEKMNGLAVRLKADDERAAQQPDQPYMVYFCDEGSLLMQLADSAFSDGRDLKDAIVRIIKTDAGHMLATASWDDGHQVLGGVAGDRPLRRIKPRVRAESKQVMQYRAMSGMFRS